MRKEIKTNVENQDVIVEKPKRRVDNIFDPTFDTINRKTYKEEKAPESIKDSITKIYDEFREIIVNSSGEKKVAFTKKMNEEIAKVESWATRDGVNFSKCQMGNIAKAYKENKKVEWESLSPYLSDYNTVTGEMWSDNLTEEDIIGLELAKLLKHEFPKARMISLYDEYNSNLADSETVMGAPTEYDNSSYGVERWAYKNDKGNKKGLYKPIGENIKEAAQLDFPPKVKENFRLSLEGLFRKNGIIDENDESGKNYLLVSESSKTKNAEELVLALENKGKIKIDGKAIYFVNPKAENPELTEITLRTKNGRWLCPALDASAFISPENTEITHLVILKNEFRKQQDQVWEILHSLGIEPTNYHNIFYDEKQSPEKVVQAIREEVEKYIKS